MFDRASYVSSDLILAMASDDADMSKEARKRLIVRHLVERDLVLPPKPLHLDMRRQGHVISISTVRRLLRELDEEGRVEQPDDYDGYYRPTDAGREWALGDE